MSSIVEFEQNQAKAKTWRRVFFFVHIGFTSIVAFLTLGAVCAANFGLIDRHTPYISAKIQRSIASDDPVTCHRMLRSLATDLASAAKAFRCRADGKNQRHIHAQWRVWAKKWRSEWHDAQRYCLKPGSPQIEATAVIRTTENNANTGHCIRQQGHVTTRGDLTEATDDHPSNLLAVIHAELGRLVDTEGSLLDHLEQDFLVPLRTLRNRLSQVRRLFFSRHIAGNQKTSSAATSSETVTGPPLNQRLQQ